MLRANVSGSGGPGALESEEGPREGLGLEVLDEDGLRDPEVSGNLREGRIRLVGELRQEMVEEGTRGIAQGAEDAEGNREEVAVRGHVLAHLMVLEHLARLRGRVRVFPGLFELRLDKRIGDDEVKVQLRVGMARNASGKRNVRVPCGLSKGLGHGDRRLLGEGDVRFVERGGREITYSIVRVDDATTLLARAEMVASFFLSLTLLLVQHYGGLRVLNSH